MKKQPVNMINWFIDFGNLLAIGDTIFWLEKIKTFLYSDWTTLKKMTLGETQVCLVWFYEKNEKRYEKINERKKNA